MHSQTFTALLAIAANHMTSEAFTAFTKDAQIAFINSRIETVTNELNELSNMRKVPVAFYAQRKERMLVLNNKLKQFNEKLAVYTA